jgi:polyphenol oxidase
VKVEVRERSSVKVVGVDLLDKIEGIDYIFTTRAGGSGSGALDFDRKGFNEQQVRKSYEVVAESLGIEVSDIFVMNQVHGARVTVLKERPKKENMFGVVETDGAVTNLHRLALSILTADCVPLLMADINGGLVGAVHAGWRGTVAGISTEAVKTMVDSFGSRAEDIVVAMGPAIGPCCYEVGPEVAEEIQGTAGLLEDCLVEKGGGKFRLDLYRLNRHILEASGIRSDNIVSVDLCTHCNQDLFYSYRREGEKTGRMLSAIMIK